MYRIGIDLGGTNIVAGVVDDNYRIVGLSKCKTNLPRPAQDIIQDMAKITHEAIAAAGLTMDDIACVGVGSPGTCNANTGIVEYSNNLRFENVPLRDMLSDLVGKKVFIENDANAAALGEALAGAAKGAQSCVCITLGTGVGGGIIIDGKIYGGFNFAGAELGHTVIVVDGEPCTCGRYGCWESYASASALIRQTRRAMEQDPESEMWKIAGSLDGVDGRTSFDAMRAGDKSGKQVVDRYIRYIASGLINVINIFQPEILCIGGGICKEGDILLKPLEEQIKKERYSKFSSHQTRLTVAQLGNDAGIIGAACIG
ncbi:MAG: ROK family protein [Oscillospiraceae bacterium]|nr:ROK family protein [Oscillospiraceae bacterium]MDD4413504.1 ROK family protein [Oscillospiraceae bacterium]